MHKRTLLRLCFSLVLVLVVSTFPSSTLGANNIHVANTWLTVSGPPGSGFGKAVTMTERPNESFDVNILPLVIVGMPDFNTGAGSAYLYKLERDVVGDNSKYTGFGQYNGLIDFTTNPLYGGNTNSLVNGLPLGAGMGFYLGVGNITSNADNMQVLLGAKSAQKQIQVQLNLFYGFEACPLGCNTTSNPSLFFRIGQIALTQVSESSGWRSGGALFSSTPPSSLECYNPFPDELMSDASLRRTYGARPVPNCSSQMGSSVAVGKVWNPFNNASYSTDNQEMITGAPTSDRVFVWSIPPGSTAGPVVTAVIKPAASVTLTSFSTYTSISPVARAALEWGSYFGESVTSGGSLNGDLWDDIVVGAPRRTDIYRQRAFVGSVSAYSVAKVNGQPSSNLTIESQPFFEVFGTQTGGYFGWQSLIADVIATTNPETKNLPDLIVSAPMESVTLPDGSILPDVGCIYVYVGSGKPTGPFQPYSQRICGRQTGERFGYSVGVLGDINQDGIIDIGVGAPRYDANATVTDVGCLYIFLGDEKLLNPNADQIICGTNSSDNFGTDFDGRIDYSKDAITPSYPDIIVGIPNRAQVVHLQSRAVASLFLNATQSRTTGVPGQYASFRYCVQNKGPSVASGVLITHRYNYTCGSCPVPGEASTTLPAIAVGASFCVTHNMTSPIASGCCNIEASAQIFRISQGPNDIPMTFKKDSVIALAKPLTVYVCPPAPATCGYDIGIDQPVDLLPDSVTIGKKFTLRPTIRLLSSAVTSGVTLTFNVLDGMRLDLASSNTQGAVCTMKQSNMDDLIARRSVLSTIGTVLFPSYSTLSPPSTYASRDSVVTCFLENSLTVANPSKVLTLTFDTTFVSPFATSFNSKFELTSNSPDTNPSDNTVVVAVPIAPPSVEMTIYSDQTRVVQNYPFTFSIRLYNAGGSEARNLILNVTFPFYMARLVAISNTVGSCDVTAFARARPTTGIPPVNGEVPFVCTLRRLAPGEVVVFPIIGAYNLSSTVDTDIPFSASATFAGQSTPVTSTSSARVVFSKSYSSAARQVDTSAVGWGIVVGLVAGVAFLLVLFLFVNYFGFLTSKKPTPPWSQLRIAYERDGDPENIPAYLLSKIPPTKEEVEAEQRAKIEAREAKRREDMDKAERDRIEKERIREAERNLKEAEKKLHKRPKASAFFNLLSEQLTKEDFERAAEAAEEAEEAKAKKASKKPMRRFSFNGKPWPTPPPKAHPSGAQTFHGYPNLGKGKRKDFKAALASFADDRERVKEERAAAKAAAKEERAAAKAAKKIPREQAKKIHDTVSKADYGNLSADEIAALAEYGFLDAALAANLTVKALKKQEHKPIEKIVTTKAAAPAPPAPPAPPVEPTPALDLNPDMTTTHSDAIDPASLPKPPSTHDLYLDEDVVDGSNLPEVAPSVPTTDTLVSLDDASPAPLPPPPPPPPPSELPDLPPMGESLEGMGGASGAFGMGHGLMAYNNPGSLPPPPPRYDEDNMLAGESDANMFPSLADLMPAPAAAPLPPPPPSAVPVPIPEKPKPKVFRPAPLSPPGDNTLYDSD